MTNIQHDINECKSFNSLNQANYKKMFIIYYGYSFEDPEKVYAIDYREFKLGKDLGIKRRHDDGQLRSVTFKSHTNDKHEQEITDEEEEVKTEPDRQSNFNMIKHSPVKSIKTKLDA